MKRIVAKGLKRSDAHKPARRVPLPQPDQSSNKRKTADGPAPASVTQQSDAQRRKDRPSRTVAQNRKDASNVRVVADSLRDQAFLALLQRGAPDIVRIYLGTKAKSRGCGGCGMRSLFRMVHDEISKRREMPALSEAISYLGSRGWS